MPLPNPAKKTKNSLETTNNTHTNDLQDKIQNKYLKLKRHNSNKIKSFQDRMQIIIQKITIQTKFTRQDSN